IADRAGISPRLDGERQLPVGRAAEQGPEVTVQSGIGSNIHAAAESRLGLPNDASPRSLLALEVRFEEVPEVLRNLQRYFAQSVAGEWLSHLTQRRLAV